LRIAQAEAKRSPGFDKVQLELGAGLGRPTILSDGWPQFVTAALFADRLPVHW